MSDTPTDVLQVRCESCQTLIPYRTAWVWREPFQLDVRRYGCVYCARRIGWLHRDDPEYAPKAVFDEPRDAG